MPFSEDFSEFTDPDAPGVAAATYAGVTICGQWEKQYVDALGVESSGPRFSCAAADVPGVDHGDTLTIDAVAYTVRGVQPDGAGWVTLILEAP